MECDLCGFKLKNLELYNRHLYTHRFDSFVSYKCTSDGCGKYFGNFQSFKSHIYRKHKVSAPALNHLNLVMCKGILANINDDNNIVALNFISAYFKEKTYHIFQLYPIGTVLHDIQRPTNDPWFAVVDTGDQRVMYVFMDKDLINSSSANFEQAFAQTFALYFIFNIKFSIEVSQTLDFAQRFLFNIQADTTRGEKKNINAQEKVSRFISCVTNI